MSHTETIRCPECSFVQTAYVGHTNMWNVYLHNCTNCDYLITESEWNEVKPIETIEP